MRRLSPHAQQPARDLRERPRRLPQRYRGGRDAFSLHGAVGQAFWPILGFASRMRRASGRACPKKLRAHSKRGGEADAQRLLCDSNVCMRRGAHKVYPKMGSYDVKRALASHGF